jgi:hypothetical protein
MAAPIRFLSGRQQQQKIGIEGSTDNQKVLEVVGQVGIGTTVFEPSVQLEVRGDASVSGVLTAGSLNLTGSGGALTVGTLNATGVSTFGGAVDANAGLDVDGQSDLDEVVVAGVATFSAAVDINSTLDVDGDTQLDDLNVAGVSTFSSAVNATDIIKGYKYTAVPYGSTVTLAVTVASKDSTHRYNGTGSGNGYVIDGIQAPFLTLTPGRTYRFTNDNTGSHPLKFYLEADKTTLYETNVNFQDTYTEITVTDETPIVLHYQCTAHGYMGNAVQTNANVVNTNYPATIRSTLDVTGVSTFPQLDVSTGGLDVDGLTNLDEVIVAGVSTFTGNIVAVSAEFSGNVTIAGTLTAEDKTNIDSLGIVTARTGVRVDAGGLIVTAGVSTFTDSVDIDNGVGVVGGLTADSLTISGVTTGINAAGISSFVRIDVDGQADLDELVVAGVATFQGAVNFDVNSEVNIGTGVTILGDNLHVTGIISAAQFIGDGSGITNLPGISTLGSSNLTDVNVSGTTTTVQLRISGVGTAEKFFVSTGGLEVDGQSDLDELVVAGVSTFSANTFINADLSVTGDIGASGIITATGIQLVAGSGLDVGAIGVLTALSVDVSTGGIDVDGQSNLDEVVVAGVATFSALADVNNRLDVAGGANIDQLNVAGIASFTQLDVSTGGIDVDGQATLDELVVAGVSTFTGTVKIDGALDIGVAGVDVEGLTNLDELIVAGVSTFSSDISIADKITHTGDTNTALRFPAADTFTVETSGNERIRVSAAGTVSIGSLGRTDWDNSTNVGCQFQIEGTTLPSSRMSITRNSNNAFDGGILLGKSRGTSDGSSTIVQDGDGLGFISFQGADGTTMIEGAKIDAIVQSSVASDDMPTDLVFYTNNDTTLTEERLRITSAGNVGIDSTVPSEKLDVAGNIKSTGTINNLTVGRGAGNQATNTALGFQALNANTTGTANVASGYQSLLNNDDGINNAGFGYGSLKSNTSGDYNIGLGIFSVQGNQTGNNNVGLGAHALQNVVSGSNNVAIGYFAGRYLTGSNNTILGAYQGTASETSISDTVIISAGTAERLRITSTGLVGIGITNPTSKLDVVGDAKVTGVITATSFSGSGANLTGIGTQATNVQAQSLTVAGISTFNDDVRILAGGLNVTGVSTFSSDISIADKIVHTGDTDTAIRFPAANTFSVETAGSERLRVLNNGVVAIGTDESTTINFSAAQTQIFGTVGDRALSLMYTQANASGPQLNFAKGRDLDNSASTAVSSGDLLGSLHFAGADGSDFNSVGAEIVVKVDGTPGSNDMPGRIEFKTTADGESTTTERLRITSGGLIGIGTDTPGANLDVEGTLLVGTSGVANGTSTINGHLIVDRTGVSVSNPWLTVQSSGSNVFYVNGGGSVFTDGDVNALSFTAGTSGSGDGNSSIFGSLTVDRDGASPTNTWFQVKNGTTPIIYANGQGKVGIGSDVPTANLDVVGNIKSTGGLDVDGQTDLDELVVAGVSTFNDDVRITAGGINVSGVGTFTGLKSNDTLTVSGISNLNNDVIFDGASYNASWDKSANTLNLSDNAKATFGTGNDLEIYHDGSNSYINITGAGNLLIGADTAGVSGIITATGINVVAGSGLHAGNTGVVTATTFVGNLTGTASAASGLSTTISINTSGIITATSFAGDGSALTGIAAGGSGEFNTGISSSRQIVPLSFESTVFTFPSTAGKQYVIESINVANVDESVGVGTTVNIIASIQDATAGEQTYIAYNVPIVTGGLIELLKNPIVAGPSDVIRMWSTNDAYAGVGNAADVYMNFTEHSDSTDFISKFASTASVTSTDTTTLYTSTSNPTVIEKIGLANRTDIGDFPISIKITNGTSTSYLAKDLIIPRYSTVDILDRQKRIETGAKIEVEVGSTSTIDIIIAGKKITS